jgi:hypothetical protein
MRFNWVQMYSGPRIRAFGSEGREVIRVYGDLSMRSRET